MDRVEEARGEYERVLEISREAGNPLFEAAARGNLGNLYLALCEAEKARPYLEDAIVMFDELAHYVAGTFRGSLALVEAEQGDFRAARALLAQGEAPLRGTNKYEYAKFLCNKARVEHLAGDRAAANAAFTDAGALIEALNVGPRSELNAALAEARAAQGKTAKD